MRCELAVLTPLVLALDSQHNRPELMSAFETSLGQPHVRVRARARVCVVH